MSFSKSLEKSIQSIKDLDPINKSRISLKDKEIQSVFFSEGGVKKFVTESGSDALSRLVALLQLRKSEELISFASGSLRDKIVSILKLIADSNGEACCILGIMLLENTKTLKEGVTYINNAVEKGCKPDPCFLDKAFSNALNLLKKGNIEDKRLGATIVLLAAVSCYAPALFEAGILQKDGKFATKDYVHAYKWLALAHEFDAPVRSDLSTVSGELADFERDHSSFIEDGQEAAKDFKKENKLTFANLPGSSKLKS